jgi:hypothetical protein
VRRGEEKKRNNNKERFELRESGEKTLRLVGREFLKQ